MNQSLLIELGTEDLPARFVQPLAQALAQGIGGGLAKRGVAIGEARTFATPRRIAVLVEGVGERQADQNIERKGPQLAAAFKDGQPTTAALGFAKSCGVEFKDLKQENGNLVFRKKQKGRKTLELIAEIFEETLKQMDQLVPKRMRWGTGEETFVRPVQWILALYGSRIVPLERFGLKAGRKTYGHRFHAPRAISLKSLADYEPALREAKVWADFDSRRAEIKRQIEAEAVKLQGRARIADELLDEVTALVEWPVAISGRIEERFLQLPPEVVVTTVETNQRYFTLFDPAGKLLPYFITVANIESKDVAQVIAGNERVVRPRLTDALFFWEQDCKQPLAAYGEKLATVTFQKDLGSIGDKVVRVCSLAKGIAADIDADIATVGRAAELCKNDLVTRMVYEFPELQGIVGGYYARVSKESGEVARAITEHYRPTQAGGPLPWTRECQVVALADKLDTLAGIFGIGQQPTSTKDPYALRRAALGVIRILVEGQLPLDLYRLVNAAFAGFSGRAKVGDAHTDLETFIYDRLVGYFKDRGYTPQQVDAVLSQRPTQLSRILPQLDWAKALQATEAGKTLAAASKRVGNILKSGPHVAEVIRQELMNEPQEKILFQVMERAKPTFDAAVKEGRYLDTVSLLSEFKEPVDAYFESVLVMAEDPAIRANRLRMLFELHQIMNRIADISKLAI